MKQYCPQCVVELMKDRKKLGSKSIWFVCPECGHRERPIHEGYEQKKANWEIDRMKNRNKNLNQFNWQDEKGIINY